MGSGHQGRERHGKRRAGEHRCETLEQGTGLGDGCLMSQKLV